MTHNPKDQSVEAVERRVASEISEASETSLQTTWDVCSPHVLTNANVCAHKGLAALTPGDHLPGGLVVVPVELTEKMMLAGQRPDGTKWTTLTGESLRVRWRAMIEASHD